jgi:hypothetical protein
MAPPWARSSPKVGPGATVGTFRQGYPLSGCPALAGVWLSITTSLTYGEKKAVAGPDCQGHGPRATSLCSSRSGHSTGPARTPLGVRCHHTGADPRKPCMPWQASGTRTPRSLLPLGRGPTRRVAPRQASGPRSLLPLGRGPTCHVALRRLQPGQPCRVSCGSKASQAHQPNHRIKCRGCACRGRAWAGHCHEGRPAVTTVSPPVTEAARHITVRRPAVLR